MPQTELYGGAFSAFIPNGASEVGDFRKIPDNREVFRHAETDQSIIIEMKEYDENSADIAIKTHFEDVARENDVSPHDSQISHVEKLSEEKLSSEEFESAWYILGQQNVDNNDENVDTINIHMGLFRIPEYMSDILVTFNDPVNIDPYSHHEWSVEDFKQLLCSFKIHDTGIFDI